VEADRSLSPGRLLDLIDTRSLTLWSVQVLVLDEADRMLDLGFIHALKRIVKLLPRQRQTLLFSATMPRLITAEDYLNDPVKVVVAPSATTVERVEQGVVFVPSDRKRDLLATLLRDPVLARVLVFTRTKHGADRVVRHLVGPRHRRRRGVARHQFRTAERARRLRASRRPNRAGRRRRHRDRVLQRRGGALSARHREADAMLASRNPVGDSCPGRWPYRAACESKVAAGRQACVRAGSQERPSRPAATPTAACRRRSPAPRPAHYRVLSGIPAPAVVNQTYFGRQSQRTAWPLGLMVSSDACSRTRDM